MPRIAGVFFKTERDLPFSGAVRARLGASGVPPPHIEEADGAMLCWRGEGAPNVSRTRRVIAVLDGAIYNRAELGKTGNDAELIASLYLKHGFEKAVRKLNGDFAIALFDLENKKLWLARDRFGLKPLYYAVQPDFFAFASRPGALLVLPEVSREVNNQYVALFAVSHYRYFDNDPEKSPYRDIAQLPAAHILSVEEDRVSKKPYWKAE